MNNKDKAGMPSYELAENDYMLGMKYKDIAVKYGVTINTVKSWKKRYNWNRKSVHTKIKKVCTQNDPDFEVEDKPVADEVESVLKNEELNEKERLFCLYFTKLFNAAKAYKKAYVTCSDYTARINGCKLLAKPKIKAEIERLKRTRLNQLYLEQSDIFQKYMDIAFADFTDYVTFGNEKIKVKDDSGKTREIIVSHVDVRNDTEVDGTLITEITKGPNGIKVKLGDRMKALEWIAGHMNMASEEQRARIELIKAQKEKLMEYGTGEDNNSEKIDNISKILEQMQTVKQEDIVD